MCCNVDVDTKQSCIYCRIAEILFAFVLLLIFGLYHFHTSTYYQGILYCIIFSWIEATFSDTFQSLDKLTCKRVS